MRRILVVAALLIACGWALCAYGIVANGGGPLLNGHFAPSGSSLIEYVYETGTYLPSGFTMHTKDGSAFWFQRAFADGVRDTVPIGVPAGLSYTIPSPGGTTFGDSTFIRIFVGGHTDTLFSLPWNR